MTSLTIYGNFCYDIHDLHYCTVTLKCHPLSHLKYSKIIKRQYIHEQSHIYTCLVGQCCAWHVQVLCSLCIITFVGHTTRFQLSDLALVWPRVASFSLCLMSPKYYGEGLSYKVLGLSHKRELVHAMQSTGPLNKCG